jgi:hypothetical protein
MLDTFEIRSEKPESFEMWCLGRTEKSIWTDIEKNEEV